MSNDFTLASELLHELKMSAKRWFICFCIMVALEVATVTGFLWYLSLPAEDYSVIDQESTDRSINMIGGEYNGGKAESDIIQEAND